jgi:hypothetical protein
MQLTVAIRNVTNAPTNDASGGEGGGTWDNKKSLNSVLRTLRQILRITFCTSMLTLALNVLQTGLQLIRHRTR